ncbi:hypothetical protein TWF694_002050 [Orbilia ellipsospora]|uniref:CBM21 domain-containing protein n=1 Tax=Orbilia ellipsospora TaxID=2528407 RepID=A0AAV9X4Q7_9PEZI
MAAATSDEADQRIYDLAEDCEHLFEESLLAFSRVSDKEYRVVLEHQQRFDRWAGFLGVFAVQQTSLDSRLRNTPDIRDLVIQLLGTLKRNLQHALNFGISKEAQPRLEDPDAGEQPDDIEQVPDISKSTQAALDGIKGSLDRLHRLGVAIRKASTSDLVSRVNAFAQKAAKTDDDYAFFERVVPLILKGLYPDIGDSFLYQLAQSVTYRRRRLLYQQKHQKKLQAQRRLRPARERRVELDPTRNHEIATETKSTFAPSEVLRARQISNILQSDAHTIGVSTVTHPSALDVQNFRLYNDEPATMEAVSGPPTVTSIAHNNPYPRAPQPEHGGKHVQCEWCSKELEVPEDETEWRLKWRSHFKEDLEPYVCISEECADELKYFASLRSWRKHMDEAHTINWTQDIHKLTVWYCDSDQHDYEEFQDANALRTHLLKKHVSTSTAKKMDAILRRNVLSISREPTICPLCNLDISAPEGSSTTDTPSPNLQKAATKRAKFQVPNDDSDDSDEEDPVATTDGNIQTKIDSVPEEDLGTVYHVKLATHIAGHLKSLAFVSLRYSDDDSHSTQSRGGDLGEELSNQERPGDHYFELDSSLSFEDILPDDRVLVDENEWREKATRFKPSLKGPSTDGIPLTPRINSKAVHFDSHVEQVRHYRPTAPPRDSSPVSESDEEYPVSAEYPFPVSDESPFPSLDLSEDPPRSLEISLANFTERDNKRESGWEVRFGEIKLSQKKDALVGTVVTEIDLAPHIIVVRFTLDYWKTVSEILAEYARKVVTDDGFEYDEWNFRIKLSDISPLDSQHLFFCIRYRVGDREGWDNNSGMNYQVDFKGNYSKRTQSILPRSNRQGTTAQLRLLPKFDDEELSLPTIEFDQSFREKAVADGNVNSNSKETEALRPLTRSQSLPFFAPNRPAMPSRLNLANRYDFKASSSAAINSPKNASEYQARQAEQPMLKPHLSDSVNQETDYFVPSGTAIKPKASSSTQTSPNENTEMEELQRELLPFRPFKPRIKVIDYATGEEYFWDEYHHKIPFDFSKYFLVYVSPQLYSAEMTISILSMEFLEKEYYYNIVPRFESDGYVTFQRVHHAHINER